MMPLVSCLMPTYNKGPKGQWLVEDAIECFLRQDYPNKELVIVNDTPGQPIRLVQEYKGVIVANLPVRCRTLGEKRNVCAALAHGEVLFNWDDDDISLPWRLRLCMARIGSRDYWKPSHTWWNPGSELKLHGPVFGACCFRREAFAKIQGYPYIGVGEDQEFEKRFRALDCQIETGQIEPRDAFYLYRWNTGSFHVSGTGQDGYERAGERPITPGELVLTPRWSKDHLNAVQLALTLGGGRPRRVSPHVARKRLGA